MIGDYAGAHADATVKAGNIDFKDAVTEKQQLPAGPCAATDEVAVMLASSSPPHGSAKYPHGPALPVPVSAHANKKGHAHRGAHSYKAGSASSRHAVRFQDFPGPRIVGGKMAALIVVALLFYVLCAYVTLGASRPAVPLDVGYFSGSSSAGIFGNGSESWAQYTPYFAVEPYSAPPSGCEITQVNILQRHGARYPTKSSHKAIKAALKKLQGVSQITSPDLQFVTNFTFDLGEDDLVPFGAQESYDAGSQAYERYAFLVSSDELPFVRASSKARVVQSATNWTAGFAAGSNGVYAPALSVIISESSNDTLDDASCPALSSSSSPDAETAAWIATYTPNITAALNAGAPGADLDADDTQALISLCPFESVANEERSEWCDLFSNLSAFAGYEYWGDVDKYYNTGYGQPLGPVNGVGYINELLARLTDTPVNDSTSTNSTLDAPGAATFPLGLTFYADFTHDNLMIAVYSAMGLFPQATPLNDTEANTDRTWLASELVPFAARMVVERMSCSGSDEPYVRLMVNQAVQPLAFCDADEDGLCSLSAFVESQAYARNGGDGQWAECFE